MADCIDLHAKRPLEESALSHFRDWATGYARSGIAVFPLAPGEKVPLLSARHGGRGFRDATTDVSQIERWWRECPEANIGATPLVGNEFRQAVIDIDVQNGGDIEWAQLVAEYGAPSPTLTARTGQGGQHLWFWVSERGRSKLAHGIDCKFGDTGYVVVPPSVHPLTRQRYVWEYTESVAIAPGWLRSLIRGPSAPRPKYQGRPQAAHQLVKFVATSREGERNNRLFWAACRAAENGTLVLLRGDLEEAAITAGLDEREICAVLRSAEGRIG